MKWGSQNNSFVFCCCFFELGMLTIKLQQAEMMIVQQDCRYEKEQRIRCSPSYPRQLPDVWCIV